MTEIWKAYISKDFDTVKKLFIESDCNCSLKYNESIFIMSCYNHKSCDVEFEFTKLMLPYFTNVEGIKGVILHANMYGNNVLADVLTCRLNELK